MTKKRFLPLILALVMLATLFAACGETPTGAPKVVNLDDVTWKVAIEGGSKEEYTIDDAKAHDLTKVYCSAYNTSTAAQGAPQITTKAYEGVKVSEMLADLGVTEFKSLTVTDTAGATVEIDAKLANDKTTALAWIENKTNSISSSDALVALAPANGDKEQFVRSVAKITINK